MPALLGCVAGLRCWLLAGCLLRVQGGGVVGGVGGMGWDGLVSPCSLGGEVPTYLPT